MIDPAPRPVRARLTLGSHIFNAQPVSRSGGEKWAAVRGPVVALGWTHVICRAQEVSRGESIMPSQRLSRERPEQGEWKSLEWPYRGSHARGGANGHAYNAVRAGQDAL